MTLNAKPLILWDNLFNRSTPTATDTASGYDPLNLIDWRRHTLWKSDSLDLNVLDNPGFEDGDFTSWTEGDATIDDTNPNTGTYCAKLVAAGGNVTGPTSDKYAVNPGVINEVDFSVDVDAYVAGDFKIQALYYDGADVLISAATLETWQAATVGYEDKSKTIGPSGAGADFDFPDGTVSVAFRGLWDDTPTGTTYMDDFNLSVPAKYITVDLNLGENSGLETGDGTGWTLNDATVDDGNPNSGIYSLKLVAAGSDVDGGERDAVTVDTSKVYRLKTANDVDARAAGDYHVKLHFYDSGDNLISTSILNTWQAATVGYEAVSKQIGPGGDVEFPAGTASISVQDAWDDTPTGTAYMDDVLFYEEKDPDALGLVNHNFWSANATVSLESSVDATEAAISWTERVVGFTPDNDKAIWKSFTAVGTPQRAWRLKIVTANLAPYLGMTFLGEALEFPRYMSGEWDPLPYNIRASTGTSEGGNWLGAVVEPFISENTLQLVNLTDAFVRDTFGPVFNNHIRQLLPWVFVWDETNHADDVSLLTLRAGAQKSFPYNKSTRSLTLEVTQVVEE